MIPFELLNKFRIYLSKILMFVQKGRFFKYGKNSTIVWPAKIRGSKFILIENNVFIREHSWLAVLKKDEDKKEGLVLGDGTYVGRFFHITATNNINIGKNVLIADKVYISDNVHEYQNPSVPIIHQEVKQLSAINIGDGSWLGENVCVIGASVGKNCVIGANAVVTKDIPDYCVAVGTPARVIKKYDQLKREWITI